MRRVSLALGIIVVFIGVITCSASNLPREFTRDVRVGVHEWAVSGYFDNGDKLFVRFPAPKWEGVPNGGGQRVTVDIFDPNGNMTEFRVWFKKGALDHINVSSYDGGLILDEPLSGVGGVTQYSGNYTARLDSKKNPLIGLYYNEIPPLELFKIVVEQEYPFRSVLPIGIILIVVGVSLLIWSAMHSERTGRTRKKRV